MTLIQHYVYYILIRELIFILCIHILFGWKGFIKIMKPLLYRFSLCIGCSVLTVYGLPNFFVLFAGYWFIKDVVMFYCCNTSKTSLWSYVLCLFFTIRRIFIASNIANFISALQHIHFSDLYAQILGNIKKNFVAYAMEKNKPNLDRGQFLSYLRAISVSPAPETAVQPELSDSKQYVASVLPIQDLIITLNQIAKKWQLLLNNWPNTPVNQQVTDYPLHITHFFKKNVYAPLPSVANYMAIIAKHHVPLVENIAFKKLWEFYEIVLISEMHSIKKAQDVGVLLQRYIDVCHIVDKELYKNSTFCVSSGYRLHPTLDVIACLCLNPELLQFGVDKIFYSKLDGMFLQALWHYKQQNTEDFMYRLSVTQLHENPDYTVLKQYTLSCMLSILVLALKNDPSHLCVADLNLLQVLNAWEKEISLYIDRLRSCERSQKIRPANFSDQWIDHLIFAYIVGLEALYHRNVTLLDSQEHIAVFVKSLNTKIERDLTDFDKSPYYKQFCIELDQKANQNKNLKIMIKELFPNQYTKHII